MSVHKPSAPYIAWVGIPANLLLLAELIQYTYKKHLKPKFCWQQSPALTELSMVSHTRLLRLPGILPRLSSSWPQLPVPVQP